MIQTLLLVSLLVEKFNMRLDITSPQDFWTILETTEFNYNTHKINDTVLDIIYLPFSMKTFTVRPAISDELGERKLR